MLIETRLQLSCQIIEDELLGHRLETASIQNSVCQHDGVHTVVDIYVLTQMLDTLVLQMLKFVLVCQL